VLKEEWVLSLGSSKAKAQGVYRHILPANAP
jgi:hypothetical protein